MKQQQYVQKNNWLSQPLHIRSIAILITGVALFLISCENDIKKIKQLSDLQNQPNLVAEGLEVISSDSTVIRYKMNTPKLISHMESDPPYYEFPIGVHLEKFDAKMKITASIKSNYAKQFTREKRWEAKNNVIAVFENGDSLKTEHLIWDETKKKIYTDQFFKIIQKDRYIIGIGLDADQDLSVWKIKEPKGTFYMDIEGN